MVMVTAASTDFGLLCWTLNASWGLTIADKYCDLLASFGPNVRVRSLHGQFELLPESRPIFVFAPPRR